MPKKRRSYTKQLNTAELQYLRKLAESLTKLANGCAVKNGK